MQELLLKGASYMFLAGVLMVCLSAFPAVRKRWPRGFMTGFLLAALSPVVVLLTALLVRS